MTDSIQNVHQLEALLSEPTLGVVQTMGRMEGDLIVLGVAGKMGPSLARMARRASDLAGRERRVIGVARFSAAEVRAKLEGHGIETIGCDLLDEEAVRQLPDAPNVLYLAGMKFGATGQESLTWAMNSHLPAIVCRRFPRSRIVAFSTGNVYGLVPAAGGRQTITGVGMARPHVRPEKGASEGDGPSPPRSLDLHELAPATGAGSLETDQPAPIGEYAMSCLGRERIFEHFSRAQRTAVALIRLNYACDLRYGVLVDLAQKVLAGAPVDLAMSWFNTIWQGDANAMTLCCFDHAASPPLTLNLTGPELLNVRATCEQFGELLGREPVFASQESPTALLSNAQRAFSLFGHPRVSAAQLITWVADWLRRGAPTLNRPTHFESRNGKF
jgi:nucleoside-diphosphate-sugar epimerase